MSRQRVMVFDVDDTLYDQLLPFYHALETVFPAVEPQHYDTIYRLNRHYSDATFAASQTGAMSLEAMHIYRIQMAMRDHGVEITDETAHAFQVAYQDAQGQITLLPEMADALSWCQAQGIPLGIITNGPAEHQRNKIEQLGVGQWIPEEHWVISGAVGVMKPDSAIFDLCAERMGYTQEEADYYYIGDSLANDVIGAHCAGWRAVWLDRGRGHAPVPDARPEVTLTANDSLLDWLQRR